MEMMKSLIPGISQDVWEHKIKHFLYGDPLEFVHPGEKEFGDDFRMCGCCRKKIFIVKGDKIWGDQSDHWNYCIAVLYLTYKRSTVEMRSIEICCSEKCTQEIEDKIRDDYNNKGIEPKSRILEFKNDFRPCRFTNFSGYYAILWYIPSSRICKLHS
jgi:hypothetical protein